LSGGEKQMVIRNTGMHLRGLAKIGISSNNIILLISFVF
jgi:hypothetical protein